MADEFEMRKMEHHMKGMKPATFFYLMFAIVVAIAFERALLTSWQSGGFTALQSVWANAGLLLGLAILWFVFLALLKLRH